MYIVDDGVEDRKKELEEHDYAINDDEFGEVARQCQHYRQICHKKLHCFDLNPYVVCQKETHLSKRCQNQQSLNENKSIWIVRYLELEFRI